MPTKSALSGARRADVTGFGVPEHHRDGSALPMLVKSGNISLNKADIQWMSAYRLTPWVPNNQNAEVSHNTIRMANSTPPAMGSAQPG